VPTTTEEHIMKRRFYAIASMVAMFAMVLAPAATAQPTTDAVFDITDQVLEEGYTGEVLLTLTNVVREGERLVFSGTITGEVTDAVGDTTEIDEVFTSVPGTTNGGDAGRCDILFLDLSGLELDLLGLNLDLDLVLDLYAVPGAGNLLGNLLCAVAGLLDGPGLLGNIGATVDRLLGRINNLLG
jgi:hypothetical protein